MGHDGIGIAMYQQHGRARADLFRELVGSDAGLGHAIQVGTAQLETARVFAAVLILSVMAIALFGLVALVERRAVPWARAPRERP